MDDRHYHIHALKHDGRIAKEFPGEIFIGEFDNCLVYWADKGKTVTEVKKQTTWVTHYSRYAVFPKDAYYNLFIVEKENGPEYYCNLASPPTVSKTILSYVDYDVDIMLSPDGTVSVHDLAEFEERIGLYHYSDAIVKIIRKTQAFVERVMTQRAGYFSAEFYETIVKARRT